jgi:hypothetical protein
METIQLTIANTGYASELRDLLVRNAGWTVREVQTPDTRLEGVIVLDTAALGCLPRELPNPERIVLVTQNDPRLLAKAWEVGIVSVVFENDPMNTALLAIMAAQLRVGKALRQDAAALATQAARADRSRL